MMPANIENTQALSLGEIIDIALINNPDTKKSWAQAKVAAANYGQSLSPYFPSVDLSTSYNRSRTAFYISLFSIQRAGKPYAYYQTQITPEVAISYTILDCGERKATSEMARRMLNYADWMHNREMQTIIKIVMEDYYNVQYQIEALSALEADLHNAKTTLDAADQKFSVGVASISDITQAKTKYLQTKLDLITQQKNLLTSYYILAKDAGLPANLNFQIQKFPENIIFDTVIKNVDELIVKAQTQRQDLLASQEAVYAKEAQIKQKKAESMPILKGNFNIGRIYFNNNVHEDYHFNAGLKLSFPLFRGFYYKNSIKSAYSDYDLARSELENTELNVIKDITTNHTNVKSAADTLKYSNEYLQTAEKRFDIALANYKAGTNTILEVLAAQSSLADARAKKADAQKRWFSSLASLAYATGSLCFSEEEKKNEKIFQ